MGEKNHLFPCLLRLFLLKLPPFLLRFVHFGAQALVEYLFVGLPLGNHLVDGSPVGQSSNVAVIYPHVGLQLAAESLVLGEVLFGEVLVDGVEFHSALAAPFYGVFQQFSLAYAPEDQLVSVLDEHLQGLGGKGQFLANLGIGVSYAF